MPDLNLPQNVIDAINVAVADVAASDQAQTSYDDAKLNTATVQAQTDGMNAAAKQQEQSKLDLLQSAQQKQAVSTSAAVLALQKALKLTLPQAHQLVLEKLVGMTSAKKA